MFINDDGILFEQLKNMLYNSVGLQYTPGTFYDRYSTTWTIKQRNEFIAWMMQYLQCLKKFRRTSQKGLNQRVNNFIKYFGFMTMEQKYRRK